MNLLPVKVDSLGTGELKDIINEARVNFKVNERNQVLVIAKEVRPGVVQYARSIQAFYNRAARRLGGSLNLTIEIKREVSGESQDKTNQVNRAAESIRG